MIGERISRIEKFLRKEGYKVKQRKNENPLEYLSRLYLLEQDWENEHQREFPV